MRGYRVPVRQVPEITVDDPIVVNDQVTAFIETLDGEQCTVRQPMFAVLRLAAGGNTNPISRSHGQLRPAVCLDPLRKLCGWLVVFTDNNPRALLVADGILKKLEHIARLVLCRIGLLRFSEVKRRPGLHKPLILEFALCLEFLTD